MQLPPALGPGARVALVAPAGPLRGPEELAAAVAHAADLGWTAVAGDSALARTGYLAGSDADRVGDLNRALADERVDAVWCLRGGYGAMRLLADIDYDALRRRPKPILGYSDITALHAAVGRRCDLVSFHGPTARGALTPFARDSLQRALIQRVDPCGVAADARVLRGGRATGPLVGGNLALLAALAGTPFAPSYDGAILVVEDVGEAPYRIDRLLRQLQLSGALARVAGIAFGHFTESGDSSAEAALHLDGLLREAADVAGVPAIAGIPMGHVDDQWTIPLGAMAELDADGQRLTVLFA